MPRGVHAFTHASLIFIAAAAPCRNAIAQQGADSREAISVAVDAVEQCPPRDAFLRGVLGRTNRVKVVAASGASRRFSVELFEADGRFVGRLKSVDTAGEVSERKLEGAQCTEVSDGLALVLALAVDASASLKATRDVAPSELEESVAAPMIPQTPAVRPELPAGRSELPQAKKDAIDPKGESWRVIGRALATTGISVWREALLGARGGVGIDSPRVGPIGLSLTFDVDYQQTVGVEIEAVPVVMRFVQGVAQACPLNVRVLPELDLGACLVAEAGVLLGEGLLPDETVARPWGGVGHGFSLRYWPDARVGLVLEVQQLVAVNRPPVIELGTGREVLESRWTSYALALGITGSSF